jgi:chorismate-pyruvate lyase
MVHRYYDKPQDRQIPNLFRCEGFVRDGRVPNRQGEDLPIHRLPPFLRALLVTDGTVTKMLEAYFWEPVEVQTLEQGLITAERPIAWLDVRTGDEVLIRRARLQGTESDARYANAFSVIRVELIPKPFRRRLIDREIGIGVLIRDSGMESYREVLEVGIEPPDGASPADSDRIFRTYRIIIGAQPVILITESFPLALYR